MRREAIYYGTQNLVEGIVEALHAVILAGLLLLGSSAENATGIRLVGPVAGGGVLIGYLAFRRYTLPDTVRADTVPLPERAPELSRPQHQTRALR
jgi:hypothetical protein